MRPPPPPDAGPDRSGTPAPRAWVAGGETVTGVPDVTQTPPRPRNRALTLGLLATITSLLVLLAVGVEASTGRPLGTSVRTTAGPIILSGPATVAPRASMTIRVRVKRGVRGKVALQVQRGARWVLLRTDRLPADGRIGFEVRAPGSAGAMRLRARVGKLTSRKLTVTVQPKPTGSGTPDPSPTADPDYDARCKAQFGSGTRVLEKEHRIRPTGWPATPTQAVLCRLVRVSDTEEYGCYATDPGTKIFDIFWYYDHAITAGEADNAPIGDGKEILTGVVGDASFYIQQDVFDQYYIVWARDGEYDDTATITC